MGHGICKYTFRDKQYSNRDCGLFSIANASVLAFKGGPGTERGVSTDLR